MNAVSQIAPDNITNFGIAIVQIPPGSKAPQHADLSQPVGYFTDGDQVLHLRSRGAPHRPDRKARLMRKLLS